MTSLDSSFEPAKYATPANLKMSEAYETFFANIGIVSQFRTVAEMGIPLVKSQYTKFMSEFMDEMKPGQPLSSILVDPESSFSKWSVRSLQDTGN